jgi:hypothetical protein
MCFSVTKFSYNEYNFVTRTISLYWHFTISSLQEVHRLDVVRRQQPVDVTEVCADKGKGGNRDRMGAGTEIEASLCGLQ